MNLDQLKLSLYKDKSQLIVFDDDGVVLESCDSMVVVTKGVNICEHIPFLHSIRREIFDLLENENCEYKRMNIDFFGRHAAYDCFFQKIKWQDKTANLLLIEDQHEANKYLVKIQQGRNESMIYSETIEEENRVFAQKNKTLSNKLSALKQAHISKKALFITFIIVIMLVLLSEGLVDPVIEAQTGSFWLAMLGKLFIALLIKPVDFIVERILIRQAMRKMKKQKS